MGNLRFRPARSDENVRGARLVMETLHQFGIYLFGFGDERRAQEALESFFMRPGNRFSFQFAEIVLLDDEPAGLLMTFDRRQMRASEWATAAHMLKIYNVKEIGLFVKRMLPFRDEENIPANELYIAHLAVEDKFRRQGIGWKLLEHAEQKARGKGFPKLSLLTEVENTAARALYEKFGFELTETILFPDLETETGTSGDVRMVKILS
jgi:ribosomal protein S18 acetylase RimI-like enzyme